MSIYKKFEECPDCMGVGKIGKAKCFACGGVGKVDSEDAQNNNKVYTKKDKQWKELDEERKKHAIRNNQ